jgi:hypothetical protein
MRCTLLLFFVLLISNPCLKAQQYMSWAQGGGNAGIDLGWNNETDAAGNVYSCGVFSGTIDADPGSGVFNLTSNGVRSFYLIKYNASGNFLWALSAGGSALNNFCIVAIDPAGNPVLSGTFSGTVDFNPGPGTFNLTAQAEDIFVVKYNTSGQMIWAIQAGGAGNESAGDCAIDLSGNICITGDYSQVGTVLKLNSAGTVLWTKQFASVSPSFSKGASVAVDALDNILVTGLFSGTVDFNPGAGVLNLTSQSYLDGFLTKLDATGNFMWAKHIVKSSGVSLGTSLVGDVAGNSYVIGRFEGTADFDPGPGTITATANGFNDLFVSKYTSVGNLSWVKVLTGPGSESGDDICIDPSGMYITVAGDFNGLFDFDPGTGSYIIDGGVPGLGSGFLCRLTNAGEFVWAGAFEGPGAGSCFSVSTDGCNNLYVSGYFSNALDTEPGSNINILPSTGDNDFFTLKISQSLWTGNVSTDWHDPLNWECNTVPGVQSNVIIPTLVPRYPIVSANAEVKSLTVLTAASVQVQPGVEMKVNGHSD